MLMPSGTTTSDVERGIESAYSRDEPELVPARHPVDRRSRFAQRPPGHALVRPSARGERLALLDVGGVDPLS